jgi:hypothetical protein
MVRHQCVASSALRALTDGGTALDDPSPEAHASHSLAGLPADAQRDAAEALAKLTDQEGVSEEDLQRFLTLLRV